MTVNKVLEELNIPSNQKEIHFTKEQLEKALGHAKKDFPNEACGLIAGTVEEDGIYVKEIYLLTNIDASNEHFSLDPKEQLMTVKDARAKGLTLLGNWHSHPESPSRPSEEDKRLAYDSNAIYCILSLMEEEPVFNAFSIKNQTEVSHYEIKL